MRSFVLSVLFVAFFSIAIGCDEKPTPHPAYTGPITPVQDDQKPPALPTAPQK